MVRSAQGYRTEGLHPEQLCDRKPNTRSRRVSAYNYRAHVQDQLQHQDQSLSTNNSNLSFRRYRVTPLILTTKEYRSSVALRKFRPTHVGSLRLYLGIYPRCFKLTLRDIGTSYPNYGCGTIVILESMVAPTKHNTYWHRLYIC